MRPVMPTSRREFLAGAGAFSTMWLLGPTAWAQVGSPFPGARKPAPPTPPPTAAHTEAALARSPIPADAAMADAAIEAAMASGATYADARLVLWQRESIRVRDDHVDGAEQSESYGLGVRVLADGGWGFAATPTLSKDAAAAVARRAVEDAKRAGKLRRELGAPPVELVPTPKVEGVWVAPHETDPFDVSVADKANLLVESARAALTRPGVRHANASTWVIKEDKLVVTSDGSRVHQIFFRIMPSLTATAVDMQRGLFASRNHEAAPMLAGWEYVEGLDLPGAAPSVADDALRKLYAKSVEPGPRQVILAPSNLWLTIHESIGHPTELDRAMGLEANYAGTSFIQPDAAGNLKIGSERVNLVADRTQPGGLATTKWDDEAVPAGRWDIVRDGTFVGWQTTRDQAGWIGEPTSRGTSYGHGYDGVPFQRMPNISLQPGTEGYTTEDLINATEDGILVSGRGSWSIDHQRYNFQFSGQFFWEIKKGRLTRPLRDVAYQANTVDFWRSCDMLGGEGTYRLGGSFGDGKGQPSQSNAVSHGCPPARFKVNIVNTGGGR